MKEIGNDLDNSDSLHFHFRNILEWNTLAERDEGLYLPIVKEIWMLFL